jgi:hypothetical protein
MSSRVRFDTIFNIENLRVDRKLFAESFITQQPIDTINPILVSFGAAQENDFIKLFADGSIEVKHKGTYLIVVQGVFSRSGDSGGVARINFEGRLNGLELGSPQRIGMDKVNQAYPYERTQPAYLNVGDILEFFIARDSSGVNEGGLFSFTVSTLDWSDVPSVKISMFKVG